ncbi:MAG: thymidylate synthase [Candidatus Woesearchaeota archaeon]
MDWPIYEKENILVGNLESNIGIVTLWSPRNVITSKIDPSLYAAAGQLYFNGGISFLIRNCLSNKNIRYLILIGQDLSKSAGSLLTLKEKGIDENHNIKGIKIARIHKEIPKEAIENFRKNIEIIDMREKQSEEVIEKIKSLEKKESYGSPEIFPENKIEAPEKYPTDPSIHKIREKTVGKAWLELLHNIMRFGTVKKASYGGDQKELINLSVVIEEEDPNNPKWEEYFQFTKEELEDYIPQVTTSKKIPDVTYTYGQRLREAELKDGSKVDQIQKIIDTLRKKPYQRRAIAFTWDYDKDSGGDEPPCINFVHPLVQDDILHLTTYIRSNDMYEAWPRNALALRKLQGIIVKEISKETPLKLGTLTIISGSAHLYEKNWPDAKEITERYRQSYTLRFDPKGNFRIEIIDSKIRVTHKDLSGNPIKVYEDDATMKIIAKLAHAQVISEIGHALDIGAELQKAEIALKNGLKYTQDISLELK